MSQTAQRWTHWICWDCLGGDLPARVALNSFQQPPLGKRACCECEIVTEYGEMCSGNPLELTCAGRTGIHEEK